MAIRELTEGTFTASYTRPRHGSKESEQAWREQCREDKKSQKVISCVARGCSVETVRETTLREFEEVTAADVGGSSNLLRLEGVGAVSTIDERQAATNRGEYEYVFTKSVTNYRTGYDEGQGFNADEMDVPEETFRRSLNEPPVLVREAIDGRTLAERWVADGLAERAKLYDKLVAKLKQPRRGKAKAESEG